MKYGRNKTRMTVALKIMFVWLVSIMISSPICVYGITDTISVLNEGQCVPTIRDFVIYGSVFAFYIPLTIMLITYILTIRILRNNQTRMKNIDRSDFKNMQRHNEKCEMKTFSCPQLEDADKSNCLSDTDATVLVGCTLLNTQRYDEKAQQNQTTLLPNGECGAIASFSYPETSPNQKFQSKYRISCADNSKESDLVQYKISKSIMKPIRVHRTENVKLEQRKVTSLSCLETKNKDYPINSLCTKSQKSHLPLPGRGDNLISINSDDSLGHTLAEESCMQEAVSCPSVNTSCSILSNLIPCSGNGHFHSCSDIGRMDLKLVEWKENYSKIQKEMDQILKGDFDKEDLKCNRTQIFAQPQSSIPSFYHTKESILNHKIEEQQTCESHENTKDDDKDLAVRQWQQTSDRSENGKTSTSEVSTWNTSQREVSHSIKCSTTINNNTVFSKCETERTLLNVASGKRISTDCLYACRRQSQFSNISISSQHSMPLSDSGDSIIDPSEVSDSSECLTIKLQPTTLQMYKLTKKKSSPSSPLLGSSNTLYDGSAHQICNGMDNRNGQTGQNIPNGRLKNHTINKLLYRFNKPQGMAPVMSKRATTNEQKASKVLGIIFAVFVILWTPFFTVNILSVTCQNCMQNVTPELMSVFVWMGYTASLANPIIYTMFNTAFRRAFIRILKCHICINGSLRSADSTVMSYMYPMSLNDRRKICGQISVNRHSPL